MHFAVLLLRNPHRINFISVSHNVNSNDTELLNYKLMIMSHFDLKEHPSAARFTRHQRSFEQCTIKCFIRHIEEIWSRACHLVLDEILWLLYRNMPEANPMISEFDINKIFANLNWFRSLINEYAIKSKINIFGNPFGWFS